MSPTGTVTMADTEFMKIMKFMIFLLKSVGIIIVGKATKNFEFFKSTIFVWINMIWLFYFTVIYLWGIPAYLVQKKYDEFFFIFPCTAFVLLAQCKALAIVYQKNPIEILLKKLETYDTEPRDKGAREAYEEKAKGVVKHLMRIMRSMCLLNIFMLVSFWVGPLEVLVRSYFSENEIRLVLMFPVPYPWLEPTKNAVHYVIIYIHQAMATFFALFNVVVPDSLLHTFCAGLYLQFQALGRRAERVLLDSSKLVQRQVNGTTGASDQILLDEERVIDEELLMRNMVSIIDRHRDLIDRVADIDDIYSKATLFNFIISSMLICGAMFNVVMMDNVNMVTFLLMTLVSLWQVLQLCYYADLIMEANSVVSKSIIKCKWYDANEKFKRMMLIIMVRAQKPCRLTAYKFGEIDLKAFSKVLTTSWSYFALLNTMFSREVAPST